MIEFNATVRSGCNRAINDMSRSVMQNMFFNLLHEYVYPGTFNVVSDTAINFGVPYVANAEGDRKFYRIKIVEPVEVNAWAYRRDKSRMNPRVIEIISRHKLRDVLKVGDDDRIKIVYNNIWDKNEIKHFINGQGKWFHCFDFLPQKMWRSNSNDVLHKMGLPNIAGKTVLDVGGHTGYYCIEMWKRGAIPTLLEKNRRTVAITKDIIEHIVPADVELIVGDVNTYQLNKKYDIVLYMSVHHQFDPTYKNLDSIINKLAEHTNETFYYEAIIPFKENGSVNDTTDILKKHFSKVEYIFKYEHKLRGIRHLWRCTK